MGLPEQVFMYLFPSLSTLLVIALRQGLSLNWKLTVLTRLPGKQTLEIDLSPSHSAVGKGGHMWYLTWVLRIQIQVLMLARRILLFMKLSSKHVSVFIK